MSTIKQYIADGTNALFQIPFPYLDQNHVGVSLNGFPMNLGAHFEYIPGGGAIRFRPHVTPVANVVVEVKRETPIRQLLVQFQNGATLTQEDLNTASLQSLYSIEELWDRYETRFGEAATRLSNGQFTDAQNLIDAAVASVLESQLLADLQGRISDIDGNAESILQQTLRLNGIDATIQTIETMATDGYNAMAARLDILGAVSEDNESFILNTSTVRVSPTESLATRLEQLQVSDADNFAAVQTLQNVVTGPDGLAAQWMVKTDVNGHVAGFGLYNDGATSQFIVNAATFAISNGPTIKTPFVVSGGVVYMQNVVIQGALIENLTVGKLTSGILTASITQNADINVGTGRIIWNNGSYMKIAGTGFGTSNQFIEWFGPVMPISSCHESNAIYYLRTNGSAYFGGTLSAGTLKTSGQTSDTTASATVTIGPFGSNGNPINVVLSYETRSFGIGATGQQDQSFPISSTIYLYRTIAPGAETLVATLPLSSSCVHGSHVPGEGHAYSQVISGSVTYTDVAGSSANRTYRAVIASRSLHHIAAFQNISIIATEQ
jgi:hypothetical protein